MDTQARAAKRGGYGSGIKIDDRDGRTLGGHTAETAFRNRKAIFMRMTFPGVLSLKFASKHNCHPEQSLPRSLRQTESKDLRLLLPFSASKFRGKHSLLRRLNDRIEIDSTITVPSTPPRIQHKRELRVHISDRASQGNPVSCIGGRANSSKHLATSGERLVWRCRSAFSKLRF